MERLKRFWAGVMDELGRVAEELGIASPGLEEEDAMPEPDEMEGLADPLYPRLYQIYLDGELQEELGGPYGKREVRLVTQQQQMQVYAMSAKGETGLELDHEACWVTFNGRMSWFFDESIVGMQFERAYLLRPGENEMVIHLQDAGGGANEYTVTVRRELVWRHEEAEKADGFLV